MESVELWGGDHRSGTALGFYNWTCPPGPPSTVTRLLPQDVYICYLEELNTYTPTHRPSLQITMTAAKFDFQHAHLGAIAGRDGDVVAFRGIPYATLTDRFAEAQLVERYPAPLDATNFG